VSGSAVWRWLRGQRYALPRRAGRWLPAPGPAEAATLCARLGRRGIAATVGYFQAESDTPDTIVAACRAVMQRRATGAAPARLSVKAPPLGFCAARLRTLAEAAAAADMRLMFDAHAPADADATLAAVVALLPDFPGTGCVLPARWRRSLSDADHWRGTSAPIRVVKGEWRDPDADPGNIDAAFLALVSRLAGRTAPVAVATHQPALAERALDILIAAGTPCELEQLRGLPRRRTVAAARRRGVPVRVYIPFGPDWWPYAIDKALARPHLPLWMLRDALGLRDRAKQMGRPG
jgi:proline dehydrogenase